MLHIILTNLAISGSVRDSLQKSNPSFNGLEITPNADLAVKINGASEKDIVHSGLAFTMKRSAQKIMETSDEFNLGLDIRTGALILSLKNVYQNYSEAGFS